MTENSLNMWSGYCGRAIRLRNHRTLIQAVWLFCIGLLFLWVHPQMGHVHYWIAFFGGSGSDDGGYFSDRGARNGARTLLVISGVFLCLGIYRVLQYGMRRIDPKRHPFARKLALRGPIGEIVAEIDAQVAKSHVFIGPVMFTASWLLHSTHLMVIPMRLEDVTSVRQHVNDKSIEPNLHTEVRDLYGDSIKPNFGSNDRERKFVKRVAELVPGAVTEGF